MCVYSPPRLYQGLKFIQELIRIGQARESQTGKPSVFVEADPDIGDKLAFDVGSLNLVLIVDAYFAKTVGWKRHLWPRPGKV